jgi:hypothetical protein
MAWRIITMAQSPNWIFFGDINRHSDPELASDGWFEIKHVRNIRRYSGGNGVLGVASSGPKDCTIDGDGERTKEVHLLQISSMDDVSVAWDVLK